MLRPEQSLQISRQIEAYENNYGVGLVKVPFGEQTINLKVDKYVANPEIMNSGIQLINFLAARPDLVKGKIVTDMGTGCGIIGLAAGLIGAESVFMPDIDERAVKNAQVNISALKLEKNCEAFQSDLFSNYGDRPPSDIQVFNHPFFAAPPLKDKDWTRMMLGGTQLLGRYFEEAPQYSRPDAVYLLPWLTLAGDEESLDNDPGKRAGEYGYKIIKVTEQTPVKQGLQQSLFKIYELKRD